MRHEERRDTKEKNRTGEGEWRTAGKSKEGKDYKKRGKHKDKRNIKKGNTAERKVKRGKRGRECKIRRQKDEEKRKQENVKKRKSKKRGQDKIRTRGI